MIARYKTMTAAWHGSCQRMLYADRDGLDRWTGLTASVYDNFITADSMQLEVDLGRELWLTARRWPKLQRDYIDFDELEPFFDRCESIATNAARRGVITQMNCRKATEKSGFRPQHVWGNCMIAFTYHGGKKWNQPTIGLHSRVSYIAYLGSLDMGLAWALARKIAARTGVEVEEMAFRWYVDSLQWHGLKSVPYVFSHNHDQNVLNEKKYSAREYPAIGMTRRSILSLERHHAAGTSLERTHNPYGPARRMRQRYHRFRDGNPLPSVMLSDLPLLEKR